MTNEAEPRPEGEAEAPRPVTSVRQQRVLRHIEGRGVVGATWMEVGSALNLNHGQASGALSALHAINRLAMLTERRDGNRVYVVPEYVAGRETLPRRRNPAPTTPLTDLPLPTVAAIRLMRMGVGRWYASIPEAEYVAALQFLTALERQVDEP